MSQIAISPRANGGVNRTEKVTRGPKFTAKFSAALGSNCSKK
jgi:hypothetical protein